VKQLMLDWWNGHTQVTARTHEDYEETIQRYIVPQLGALRIQELKPRHIAAWHQALMKDGVRGKPLSVASIRRPHMLLNQALTEACRQELLVRNVVGMVKLPRDTRGDEVPERFLTKEEAQDVLARIYGRPVFPIAATALGTGARLGEILALRWGSVDLEAGTMTIGCKHHSHEGWWCGC
jgi:integrase